MLSYNTMLNVQIFSSSLTKKCVFGNSSYVPIMFWSFQLDLFGTIASCGHTQLERNYSRFALQCIEAILQDSQPYYYKAHWTCSSQPQVKKVRTSWLIQLGELKVSCLSFNYLNLTYTAFIAPTDYSSCSFYNITCLPLLLSFSFLRILQSP